MTDTLTPVVTRAINAANKIRDALYLDANAWSELAKGNIRTEPLAAWLERTGSYLWLSRIQLAELSADPRVLASVSEVLARLPATYVDRGQNELDGEPWNQVTIAFELPVHLKTLELREDFVAMGTTLAAARESVARDGVQFERSLREALSEVPRSRRSWSRFPNQVKLHIRAVCADNCKRVDERALEDRERFIGLRLAFGVLFARYVVTNKNWMPADYRDYLHAADMAYAGCVVTERNLAECIRQATRRPEITGPKSVHDLSWLRSLA